jgi:hypothetical protein
MLYLLSKVVPVRMASTYGVIVESAPESVSVSGAVRERATWWQWRGRIWRHRREAVA